jgi:4-hydroxy-tetrahydrodipicolinate synthase
VSVLTGVFPVVPTPFAPDGAIDIASFERIVDFALEVGVDGLVFPGMASEVETLSADERQNLIRHLGTRVAGRVPIIAGASDADPARAAEHAEVGRAAGAVAAMVMAPAAVGRSVEGQSAYFAAVVRGTQSPIMLQNAPPPNGAGLLPEEVAAVARNVDAVRFVKEETQPCGQNVSRIRAAAGPALDAVYGGAGARYVLDELARGAAGTMPAIELADVHVAMMRAWRAGNMARARRLYTDSLPLLAFQMVFRVRATKELLRRRGLLVCTTARAAGPKFDDGDLREMHALIVDALPLFETHVPDITP